MTFDLDLGPTDLNINRVHLLMKDYLPTKFEASGAKRSWVISCTRWSRLAWSLTLTFDLNINRDHLLIQDYLHTKFEASWAKHSWVISCTRLRDTYIPTDRLTDIPTDMCKAISPSFFKGGHNNVAIKELVILNKQFTSRSSLIRDCILLYFSDFHKAFTGLCESASRSLDCLCSCRILRTFALKWSFIFASIF